MTTIKHKAPAATELLLYTELADLPDGESKSADVSNDAAGELYLWADFELRTTTAPSRGYQGRADLYILPKIDGSNYSYGGDTVTPSISNLVGSFWLWEFGYAKVLHLRGIRLPPSDFRVLLRNMNGQGGDFSSVNTLKMARYNLQAE